MPADRLRLRRCGAARTFAGVDVFDGYRRLPRALTAPAVALGNFDGVHRGHQALLAAAVSAAARADGEAVAYTFDPHPAKVLAPALAPRAITTRARKLELLAACGLAATVVEPFDRELAAMSPASFVDDILVGALGARHVVVGFDFTFGRERAGSADDLRALGAARGFTVDVIAPVTIDGIVASSTRIRNFVSEGNLAGARLLLGRDFDVDGTVVRGAARGRQLGFPTANIASETELLPAPGIYAGQIALPDHDDGGAGTWRDAAISLGTNPTFDGGEALSLEVHVLDFDADLYDQRARVRFVERLRPERRFGSAAELVGQIRRDIDRTRSVLAARA